MQKQRVHFLAQRIIDVWRPPISVRVTRDKRQVDAQGEKFAVFTCIQ